VVNDFCVNEFESYFYILNRYLNEILFTLGDAGGSQNPAAGYGQLAAGYGQQQSSQQQQLQPGYGHTQGNSEVQGYGQWQQGQYQSGGGYGLKYA